MLQVFGPFPYVPLLQESMSSCVICLLGVQVASSLLSIVAISNAKILARGEHMVLVLRLSMIQYDYIYIYIY